MPDLSTQYLGMKLRNPLVASSSPLCEQVDNLKMMEDAGLGAVVLPSLFEEQITLESMDLDNQLWQGTDSFAESLSYFPDQSSFNLGPEGYLEHIRSSKEVLDIPVIASLNGYSKGGWLRYAEMMEQAGADALELNMYYLSTDVDLNALDVENMYLELLGIIKNSIKIPVAVKLSSSFSAFANFARQLDEVGVDGLVLFNRFYQPDFNLETLSIEPNLRLSGSEELRLRLRWAAILHGKIKADMAITGGVHNRDDILKAMMSGAKVAMTTSALLRNGIPYAEKVLTSLQEWMEENEYESIEQMQGSMSQQTVSDPAAFERANYMKVLRSYTLK
ncbi:MAG: dihydroorotate dehydrogenase-like protein [Chloroflexi bacterium]|nr:MAG: dihydroorotate dehydrogenase-like protein [Chloroflexota bacterium]